MSSEKDIRDGAERVMKAGGIELLRKWLGRCLLELQPLFYDGPGLRNEWAAVASAVATLERGRPTSREAYDQLTRLWHESHVPAGVNGLTSGPFSDAIFCAAEAVAYGISGALPRYYGRRVEDICRLLRWRLRLKDLPAGAPFCKATYGDLKKHRKRMLHIAESLITNLSTGASE